MSTSIEWTDETWNPLRGCRRISPGCEHCYAERQAARPILSGPGLPYAGLVQFGRQGPRWTGATAGPDQLDVPLRWKKPRKVFPCSMSDLFFEGFSFERIAAVFGIMAATPQHTYQVLTKRIERARRFVEWAERAGADVAGPVDLCTIMARNHGSDLSDPQATRWPLPNVWIGTSIEDQQRADERLPHLLEIPAAVRFVSYEPALEAVNFGPWLSPRKAREATQRQIEVVRLMKEAIHTADDAADLLEMLPEKTRAALQAGLALRRGIDWIIVGGESGPGARPFDLAWARSTIRQAREAGVRVFFKQAGARPVASYYDEALREMYDAAGWEWPDPIGWDEHDGQPRLDAKIAVKLRDRKGADLAELPEDLRVQEWPGARP